MSGDIVLETWNTGISHQLNPMWHYCSYSRSLGMKSISSRLWVLHTEQVSEPPSSHLLYLEATHQHDALNPLNQIINIFINDLHEGALES